MPVVTRIRDAKFRKMVRPGDSVAMTVSLQERLAQAFFMTGKCTQDGATVARIEFACSMAPRGAEEE